MTASCLIVFNAGGSAMQQRIVIREDDERRLRSHSKRIFCLSTEEHWNRRPDSIVDKEAWEKHECAWSPILPPLPYPPFIFLPPTLHLSYLLTSYRTLTMLPYPFSLLPYRTFSTSLSASSIVLLVLIVTCIVASTSGGRESLKTINQLFDSWPGANSHFLEYGRVHVGHIGHGARSDRDDHALCRCRAQYCHDAARFLHEWIIDSYCDLMWNGESGRNLPGCICSRRRNWSSDPHRGTRARSLCNMVRIFQKTGYVKS